MASKQRRESFWPRNDNRKADEANQDLSPPRRTRTLLSTNLDVQNFSKPGPLQLKMHDKSPWADHTRVMTTNQAGPGIIAAHTANRNMKRVVIKEAEGYGKDALHRLRTISSEHLVQFRAAYYYSNSIFIVYEPMEVSLNDILVTPKGRLPYTEIATVCKSILNGLQYLHKELLMECGCIDGSNVLLTGVGQVKIGGWLPWQDAAGYEANLGSQYRTADAASDVRARFSRRS